MSSLASPAEMRAYIVERLVGDTGEPDQVIESGRALAERTAAAIASAMEAAVGAPLGVEVKDVSLTRFASAKPQSSAGWAMTVAASASSPDAMVMLLDPAAMARVIDGLFGGDPDLTVPPLARDLSPTEVEVASSVFNAVAESFNGSGPRAFDLRFPLAPPLSGAELVKQALRDGPAVRMDFSLHTKGGGGTLSVMMPQRVLLKHRGDATESAASADWRQRFNDEVMRSSVLLEATMPLATLTLGDLANFKAGDLVELDEGAQETAKLSSRGKTLFVCEFGRLGQNYTVRVRHPFDAGQDFIDGLTAA